MKKLRFPLALLLCSTISYYSNAQYGMNLQPGINKGVNTNQNTYNPILETPYIVDSTDVNQVDFGKKKNKVSFKVFFGFKPVDKSKTKASFIFTKSQITGTNITRNSGITGIELVEDGFEIIYNPKRKLGLIDDYVVISTFNGRFLLRLTGEIIDSKKNEN